MSDILWRPIIYHNLVIKKHNDDYLIINVDFFDWVRIDTTEYDLFMYLKEGKEIDVIIDEYQHKELTADQVLAMLKKLIAKLVLNQIAFKTADPKVRFKKQERSLDSTYIVVTNKCNLTCPYCYADGGKKYSNELTAKEIKEIIDDSKLLGGKKIIFTGGEPLLNPDLFELARYAKKQGFVTEVLTNGILINKSNIGLIEEVFDYARVSLDGSKKEIHDQLRGLGSFEATVKGLNLLKDSNVNISIHSVITKLNFKDIPEIIRLSYEFNVQKYDASMLIPLGRGKDNNLSCSFDELKEMQEILVNSYYKFRDEPFVKKKILDSHPYKKAFRERCGTGRTEIVIDSQGNLYPCRLLQTEELLAGNIRKIPLRSLYLDSEILQNCRNIKLEELNECRDCEVKKLCAGGCRALHYAFTKNVYENNSEVCEILKDELITNIFLKTKYFPIKNKEVVLNEI